MATTDSKQANYTCQSESDAADRGEALSMIQQTWTQLFGSRLQFTTTKSTNADGSFKLTIESNGRSLNEAAPKAKSKAQPGVKSDETVQ